MSLNASLHPPSTNSPRREILVAVICFILIILITGGGAVIVVSDSAFRSAFMLTTAAETSTNASAMYWHVFNLEYNSSSGKGKYEVIPVEKILTSSCEVMKNMPEYASSNLCGP